MPRSKRFMIHNDDSQKHRPGMHGETQVQWRHVRLRAVNISFVVSTHFLDAPQSDHCRDHCIQSKFIEVAHSGLKQRFPYGLQVI